MYPPPWERRAPAPSVRNPMRNTRHTKDEADMTQRVRVCVRVFVSWFVRVCVCVLSWVEIYVKGHTFILERGRYNRRNGPQTGRAGAQRVGGVGPPLQRRVSRSGRRIVLERVVLVTHTHPQSSSHTHTPNPRHTHTPPIADQTAHGHVCFRAKRVPELARASASARRSAAGQHQSPHLGLFFVFGTRRDA